MRKTVDVLIVEDEGLSREMMELLMADLGHRVTAVASGLEAIRLCVDDGRAFDVVLMDVQMPGLDGIEATRRLRAAPATRELAIVCISAKASAWTREEGLLAGCDCYLTKPIPEDRVFGAITEVLRSRGRYLPEESFS